MGKVLISKANDADVYTGHYKFCVSNDEWIHNLDCRSSSVSV